MPVIDLRTHTGPSTGPLAECDVAIVGTGPAGATLARELSGTGLRITVLESGLDERDADADRLNDIESVGRPRVPDQWSVRNRILGGSSHTWGGRCAPFDEVDFEQRDWVPASGWPIDLDDLAPYLRRTTHHLGLAVGEGFSDDRFWALAGRRPAAASPDPDALRSFFWQFSRDDAESYPFEYTRFARGLVSRLGADVTVVLGATVVRVDPVASGRAVASVEVAGVDGRRSTLRASTVVLATGGLENARLLLASDTLTPRGLGNDHDLVGRYLMDHPRGPVGEFAVEGTAALQKRLGRYNVMGRMFRAGFRLSPTVQRQEGLLNCAAWTGEVWAADDPWGALRHIAGGRLRRSDIFAVVRGAGLLARGARDYFIEHNGVPRKLDALELLAMVEQRPDPDSRVTLSPVRDRFGVPLPRVDWRVHPDEARTMRRMADLLVEHLPRLGLPAPQLAEWVRDGADLPDSFVDVAHPTGTTRMATEASRGVVDADGQVHGVAGLYVTGTSVFPTSGHCNPTQMIVALAVRLADHLKARLLSGAALPVSGPALVAGEPARVLLTGATGRIGRVVLGDLLARGYRVRATTSKEPPVSEAGQPEWRRIDLAALTEPDAEVLVAGCSAVLHLAAEIGAADRMERVNTAAIRVLARAAEAAGVRAFCYTSTVSVYGSGRRRTAAEDAQVLTVERDVPSEYLAMDYVRTYGRTKLAGELALHEEAATMRCVVLRPAVVVDEGQILGIREWSRLKRVLAAHRHAHHVYVRDVSDALIWTMARALGGAGAPGGVETFNVAEDSAPQPTHADFLRSAYAATGDARFKVPPVPGVLDWVNDLVRFRSVSLRNPLWRMRFPSDRLRAAGWRPPYGMAYANAAALDRLRREADGPSPAHRVNSGQHPG